MELPEFRVCDDEKSHMFGSVAIKSSVPGMAWSIMTPGNGGHHSPDDAEVEEWATVTEITKTSDKKPETSE